MRVISATGRPAQHGATLLELLIVVAVMAMMSVFLPMAFDRALPARRAMAAAQEVATAVGETARMSLRRGEVAILSAAPDGLGLLRIWRLPDVEPQRLGPELPLIVHGAVNGERIMFLPDGSSSGGAIEVGQGAYRVRIEVSALTSRARTERLKEGA